MRRSLRFELLDARLCFAFGDSDPGFAQAGEHSVSFLELDRMSSDVASVFNVQGGALVVATSRSGGGPLFTISRLNANGTADPQFGDQGVIQFIDSAEPKSVISRAINLSDGRILLRTGTGSQHASYIALHADGTFDTGFGDRGFVRLGIQRLSDFAIAADNDGGFVTVESDPQTFRSTMTRYAADGSRDMNFAAKNSNVSTRLVNTQIAIDASGTITILGLDTLDGLRLKSYRFNQDGSTDTSFGTGGSGNGPAIGLIAMQMADNGQSFTTISRVASNVDNIFEARRYSADTTLDTTFGNNGSLVVNYGPQETNHFSTARLLAHEDGSYRLVIDDYVTGSIRQTKLTTYKILPTGSIDTNFAVAGRAKWNLPQLVNVNSVYLDSHGGIYWLGHTQPVPNANYIFDTLMIHSLADGAADSNWGNQGIQPLLFTPSSQRVDFMQLDSLGNGRMRLLSGWPTFNSPQPNLGLAETLDATGDVLTSSDFGRIVSKQYTVSSPSADGGWFLAQIMMDRIEITKFSSTGQQDTQFGTSGIMAVPMNQAANIAMRTSRDGSIVIAATATANDSDPATSLGVGVIIRLQANGIPLAGFGANGIQRIYSKSGNLADVLADPNLGVVMIYDPFFEDGIVMQRYLDTGVLDSRFTTQTQAALPFRNWRASEVDEVGRILLITEGLDVGVQYELHQFSSDGSLLNNFGNAGHVNLPIQLHGDLDRVGLTVRQGVIAIAAAHTRNATAVRLLAYDYAGKP